MKMKKNAATLLMLTLVGLTGLVNAQTSARITAQVPFDFVANGKTMPAGECTITIAAHNGLVSVYSGRQHAYALPAADESPNARKRTALVFHHYGKLLLPGRDQARRSHWLPTACKQSRRRTAGPKGPLARIHASRVHQVTSDLLRSGRNGL